MFECEAMYGIITYVGNENKPDPPPLLYSKEAGGNSDTWSKKQERQRRYKCNVERHKEWLGETKELAQYLKTHIDHGRTGYWRKCKRQSLSFFIRSDEWADVFIKDAFMNAKQAYWDTSSKDELVLIYLNWFKQKRRELRHKMTTELQVINENLVLAKQKTVQSHGGVANLLKVLTKTMEKQGADIRSIAKVQYTICRQAGILIPDEFIEDVAVIVNAERNL